MKKLQQNNLKQFVDSKHFKNTYIIYTYGEKVCVNTCLSTSQMLTVLYLSIPICNSSKRTFALSYNPVYAIT